MGLLIAIELSIGRALLGLLVGLIRVLLLILTLPVLLVLWVIEFLRELGERESLYEEETTRPCPPMPDSIVRRPDPSIYSQALLNSEGIPITYTNPDIWISDPANGTIVDYPDLQPETEYLVTVRVHNASLDPAFGVRVGLAQTAAPLDPGGPPVEVDPQGNEVFRFVNVAGLSSAVTQFRWRSPTLDPAALGLFTGLQVRLHHPADANRANNLGHLRIVVMQGNPGSVQPAQTLSFSTVVSNPLGRATRLSFEPNSFQIDPEQKVTLHRQLARGRARWSTAKRLLNLGPTIHGRGPTDADRQLLGPMIGRVGFRQQSRLQVVKARYSGFDAVRRDLLERDWSLPAGMEAGPVEKDGERLAFGAGERRVVRFRVQIAPDATPGSKLTVNFVCREEGGSLLGGFALPIRITEAHS